MKRGMDKTIDAEERVLAHMLYGALFGNRPSPSDIAVALHYWNRQFVSPWKDMENPDSTLYLQLALDATLEIGRSTGMAKRWSEHFDADGYPLPGKALGFLSDYMKSMIHFRRQYHQFSCHRKRIHGRHVMDFPVEHPVAVDYWTVYITHGGAGVMLRDFDRTDLRHGDVLIMPPGQKATVKRDTDASDYWEIDTLSFRSNPASLKLLDWTFSESSPLVIHVSEGSQWERVKDIMFQLENTTYRHGHYTEQLCHNLIENLLIRFRLMWESGQEGKVVDERLALVINHLLMHYQRQESLSDIARIVRLSPVRLNAIFHEQFGTSVMKWRDSLRLQKAKELLLFTELPINEVAEQVGYSDPLYFSRRYKQQFNVAPSVSRSQRGE